MGQSPQHAYRCIWVCATPCTQQIAIRKSMNHNARKENPMARELNVIPRKHLCEHLGVSSKTIKRWIASRDFPEPMKASVNPTIIKQLFALYPNAVIVLPTGPINGITVVNAVFYWVLPFCYSAKPGTQTNKVSICNFVRLISVATCWFIP